MREVLAKVDGLKPGDSRAKVESDFELDGGLQFSEHGRYSWKRCPFIKIDVKFSSTGMKQTPEFLPEDEIVSVSKPYVEYPFTD